MNISLLLLIYLVGAVATYVSGKNLARMLAIIVSFIGAAVWFSFYGQMQSGAELTESYPWIESLNIHLAFYVDGLAYSMLGLCTLLLPIILLMTNQQQDRKSTRLNSSHVRISYAMCGTFMAVDGFLYYIFWEL